MKRNPRTPVTADLLCDVCGQLPEPPKARLTLANIAVMLPIELLVMQRWWKPIFRTWPRSCCSP
ncbi:hypothetical protein SAMN05660916_04273 [Arthrobacter sp. 31Cvi3.1E]|nr:hypothetical protein SAMN05660916_04273 [Arthrobacter sp. 31Cvi3.1E]